MTELDVLKATVEQLSKRVDALEKNWSDTVTAWGALIVAAVSALLSIGANHRTDRESKAACLAAIKTSIDSARSQLQSFSMTLTELTARKVLKGAAKRELEQKRLVHESALEGLLNAYDNGCDKFFKGQVDAQDFTDTYHDSIRDLVEAYPEKFQPPITRFDRMARYYSEKVKASIS